MPRPKRAIHAVAEESTTPPDALRPTQSIARVVKLGASNLYTCALPSGKIRLVELAARFRNTIWIRRGGYVLVDQAASADDTDGKVAGEIINVVRDERQWRKMKYWPPEFVKNTYGDEEDDDSNLGKMPPSDSED